MLEQLGDLVSLANHIGLVAKILHQHDYLAAIPGIDNAGVAHQPLLGQPGARLHDATGGRDELDGNPGMHACRPSRCKREVFRRIEVVADIFSGMGDGGQHSVG